MIRATTRTLSLILATSLGCGADSPDSGTSGGGETASVTYHGHVRAVLEANCVSCHVEDGAGPFPLRTWEQVEAGRYPLMAAVDAGIMPPWPMEPGCRDVSHARVLSDEDLQTLHQWQTEGFVEGDPADYVPAAPDAGAVPAGDPDVELVIPEGYSANPILTDDYQCFLFDHVFSEETFVIASDVTPDRGELVHHVLYYIIEASNVAAVQALDGIDPSPGYKCYGGPGVPTTMLGGWVPGSRPIVAPPGAAVRVPAGAQIVSQIHYNLAGFTLGDQVPADRTPVSLWTLPSGNRPTAMLTFIPVAQHQLDIPAGASGVVAETTWKLPLPATIIGTAPHMHTLGSAISAELRRPGGAVDCLTDVPRWDFNWQQFFLYEESDFVHAHIGDELVVRCEYDNTAANQPLVDGVVQEPRDVRWGEGTLDEMCLNYFVVMTPFYAVGSGATCDGFEACARDCDPAVAECVPECMLYAEGDCAACATGPLYSGCAARECPLQALSLVQCLNTCPDGTLECAFNACADELTVLQQCLHAPLLAGACDGDLAACDVVFAD